jgi:sulfur carrier protein
MAQPSETGRICVNGHDMPFDAATVADFLAQQAVKVGLRGIAVALNGSVVPRSAWSETALKPGDNIEIVRAMQGG